MWVAQLSHPGTEFNALVADIREHGLREPIIVHEGEILDGRNRHRACQEIGIEPATVEAFVVSRNLHRRHLNEAQRSMVAAKLANKKLGDNQFTEAVGIPTASAQNAAALLNVSRDSVFEAKKVLAEGTPEEIATIERDDASVSATAKRIRKRKTMNDSISQAAAMLNVGADTVKRAKKVLAEATPDEKQRGKFASLMPPAF